MATRFQAGDWVLGADCAKCGRRTPILNDMTRGGAIDPPIKGEFHFECAHCKQDNVASAQDLERFQVGAPALPRKSILMDARVRRRVPANVLRRRLNFRRPL